MSSNGTCVNLKTNTLFMTFYIRQSDDPIYQQGSAWYSWNIAESGVKHNESNQIQYNFQIIVIY